MTNQQLRGESEPDLSSDSKVLIQKGESELSARLIEVIGSDSVSEFGRRCGIGEATIRNMIKSGASPRVEHVVSIADAANVNIEWLAAGRGPKTRGAGPVSVPAAPAPAEAAASAASSFSFDDLARMEMAIDVVQEALTRTGRQFTPEKHAKIISLAYQLLENAEQRDNVTNIIKMAA